MQMHKCLKWLTHVTKLYANDGQTELTRIWDKRRLTEEAVCVPQCVSKCVLVGDQMSHNKTKTQSKPKQSRAEVEAKAADKAKRNYEKLFTFMLNFLWIIRRT